mmetsp:Transcript_18291/g.34738  ORF Transcript_18291/g.34738 Transcript_18291/m.34738 type:complete len:145 (-) Transcript_18291:372-806(-)|eukprot:scaffold561_cov162-Amphora_coffeaeformis.AAC.3
MAAVKSNGLVLEFVCASLQNNYQIVKAVMESNHLAYRYASHELKARPELFEAVLRHTTMLRPPQILESRVQTVVTALKEFRKTRWRSEGQDPGVGWHVVRRECISRLCSRSLGTSLPIQGHSTLSGAPTKWRLSPRQQLGKDYP